MLQDPVTQNLGYLCTYYPSIADVCRRLNLNRQQFNKYLSGQVRPSRHNMRRICDFFGITESEILLEHGRLVEIISLRRRPMIGESLSEPLRHIDRLLNSSGNLQRYTGYYFRYYYSFSYPGYITKSLSKVWEKHGSFYCSTLEIIGSPKSAQQPAVSKYKGIVLLLADRIFVLEYDFLLKNSITEMILYPSYRARISYLTGIQTGASTVRGRRPGASLVLLEHLGRSIDIRKAIGSAGLFREDSESIPATIREAVRNQTGEGGYVLEASEI